MKKLSILFVLTFFFLANTTVFAQETKEEAKKEIKKEMKAYKDKAEVAVTELPDVVQKTLKESFADYNLKKAYKVKKEDGIKYYAKLEKDGKWLKVALDSEGKIIKKKEIHKKEKHSEK